MKALKTRKKEAIKKAIIVNEAQRDDVIDVLSKLGGFDIAAMCGAFIGAAASRRPAVIDGFISAVAALCACRLCPELKSYLIPSHASFEIGYRLCMEEMGLEPMLKLAQPRAIRVPGSGKMRRRDLISNFVRT